MSARGWPNWCEPMHNFGEHAHGPHGVCLSVACSFTQAGRQVGGEVGVGRQAEGQQKWSGRVAGTPTCQHNHDDPVNQEPVLTSFAPTEEDSNDGADHRNKTGMKPNL